jgi:hypothetical protein
MEITITEQYIYLIVTLVLMLIQVLQIFSIRRFRKEVEDLWQQISILVLTTGNTIQKLEKKIDEKQDVKK